MNENRDNIRKIMIAVNVICGLYGGIAKKTGIKENTLTLFYALDDGKSHSQKEICEEWLLPKTTLNTIVKECVRDGYIVLGADSGRKEKEICLTEKGRAMVRGVLKPIYQLEERAMDRTLAAHSVEFVPAMEGFTENLKEEAGKFTHES